VQQLVERLPEALGARREDFRPLPKDLRGEEFIDGGAGDRGQELASRNWS
jgi:hypothetical protein